MKRGAKICVLAIAAIIASGLMALLLMHVSLIMHMAGPAAMPPGPRTIFAPRDALAPSIGRRLLRGGSLSRSDRTSSSSGTDRCGCDVDRTFAPQCEDVSPSAWQLHRSVQSVGRLVVGSTSCSGFLLGNSTDVFFLTAARCLPLEGDATRARIMLTNCLGTRVFTHSELFHLNRELDFVVLKMAPQEINVVANFGFLRLRANGPAEEEIVYLPHYTDASSKRIAIINDEGLIRTHSLEPTKKCSVKTPSSYVSYQARVVDSASAGSPLNALADYSVVAVHLCSDCINVALISKAIVDDLLLHGKLHADFVT